MANTFRKVFSKIVLEDSYTKIIAVSGFTGSIIGVYDSVDVSLRSKCKFETVIVGGIINGLGYATFGVLIGAASPVLVPLACCTGILYAIKAK